MAEGSLTGSCLPAGRVDTAAKWGGLSVEAAAARLAKDGLNRLQDETAQSLWRAFAARLRNPLVMILAVAGLILAGIGDAPSFLIITMVLLLSVTMDVLQEHRAGNAARRLRESVALKALAVRGGRRLEIPASALVRGDIVILTAGDLVPADGIVLEARDFYVNEASLTGESFPAEKHAVADRAQPVAANMAYMGSSVVSGSATVKLTATGPRSQIGTISGALTRPPPPTDFEIELGRLSRLIMRVTIGLVLFTLLVNLTLHRPPLQSFLFAVALAVGLTPELLPMIISVSLAHGAIRLSRREVIVKRLSDIHDLGAMDILCSDKTGTLTEARIELAKSVTIAGEDSKQALLLGAVNAAFETGLKSPLDEAILKAFPQASQGWVKLDEVPFDFERRRVSVLAKKDGAPLLIVKGAAEDLLALCRFAQRDRATAPLDEESRQVAAKFLSGLGNDGFRVLAVAWREMPTGSRTAALEDKDELILAGFLAFRDPPKMDARKALADMAALGVTVKILTGDGPEVTQRVCRDLSLPGTSLLLGSEIAAMSEEALAARIEKTDMFCRVSPAQKLRILTALRRQGHVVGYIGDGINDAPSLHEADVGFSVEGAVDVAKAAAGMILLRPDLAILAEGVREGRRTHANILKYVMMAISSNFGNMLSMAAGAAILPFLPMLPVQILLNNLLYDLSELAIPMDRVDASAMEKPRRWNMREIRLFMYVLGSASSLFDLVTFFLLLYVWGTDEQLFHTGWFLESMATQILVIFVIRSATPWKSRPHPALLVTAFGALACAILLTFTVWGRDIGFAPVAPALLATLGAVTGVYLALIFLLRRWVAQRPT